VRPTGVLLALDSDRCRLARLANGAVQVREFRPEGGQDGLSMLDQIPAALAEWGCTGQGLCLGLPSDTVLAAQVDTGDLPRRDRDLAMLYRLEEQFPLAAEHLTADFLPPAGGRALGLAVQTQQVRAVIDRLTDAGVEVTAVCPTALLALWQALHACDRAADYVILADGGHVDIFRMAGRCPAAWSVAAANAADAVKCLQADLLDNPTVLKQPAATVVGELPWDVQAALPAETDAVLSRPDETSVIDLAARAACRLLGGEPTAWVDLRRDGLAPPNPWARVWGLARSAIALAMLAMVAVTGMFYCRGMRYEDAAQQLEADQVAEFQRVYPNQRKPPNVKVRLRSDLALLSGVSGSGFDMPDQPAALDTLLRITTNLPPNIRLRITEMRIDPTGIVLEGQARAHSDAELIARTLKQGGLEMDPPRTEQLVAGGVAFTMTGRLAPQGGPAKAEGGPR
jgi:hypothetical protein